jgi:ATP-binding cassette subfamily B protein
MRRRLLVPEVIQTSALDCGPASLKALFGGFGIYLSYGRLRETCQTDVDGTSIDMLESVANDLGLEVEQRMVPVDLLLLKTSGCLPAIVVTRLADGATHFVVLWRVHGPFVQVMDPAAGRLWLSRQAFLSSLYVHEQTVPAELWRSWSDSEVFAAGLTDRLRRLGVEAHTWLDRVDRAGAAVDRAGLDASVRVAHALVEQGVIRPGGNVDEFLWLCVANPEQIPSEYWTARALGADDAHVRLRGAVLLTALGPKPDGSLSSLRPSLAPIRREPPPRVWAPVWEAVRSQGVVRSGLIAAALVTAAAGTVVEALLFRGLLDVTWHLTMTGQRLAACSAVIVFLAVLLVLEAPAVFGLLRLGRQLELPLRMRFLAKIPRLGDRYFQSRLIADMAFRVHSLHLLRDVPDLAGQFVRVCTTLLVTASAIVLFYPGATLPVLTAVLATAGVPLAVHPILVERELRVRELNASLSRFYLDALLGSRAIQAHGAGRTLRAAQVPQLECWAAAGLRQHALLAGADTAQLSLSLAAVIWLVFDQSVRAHAPAGFLLLIYWALSIPLLGRQLASIVWSFPVLRNTVLRFLEPLGCPEEPIGTSAPATTSRGVKIALDDVTVIAGGHVILDRVRVRVAPGEHVAIVGRSGAGKSSLVGLLLGWHRAAAGRVMVDDAALEAERLTQLRETTAWIDPQVHLFHATMFDNLRYGNSDGAERRVGGAIADPYVGLLTVLHRLPVGLQTPLGEGGAFVSAGEGQRVRIGRACARAGVRLALLDEPARGLDRADRGRLLAWARRQFAGATLLVVSHDVQETLAFDRVLVVEHGRIVEDGVPRELADRSGSRYRALLDEEQRVHRDLWAHPQWRRVRMQDGTLTDATGPREWMLV